MIESCTDLDSHDYVRHGTTDLFAAFNIADGTVISQLRRHHRAPEFRTFLAGIGKAVPADLDVHLVCDNLSTHKAPPPGPGWPATPVPPALHAHRIVVDQPGRTVVRVSDRPEDPARRAQGRPGPRSRHPRLDQEA